jgi:hypothetical protein
MQISASLPFRHVGSVVKFEADILHPCEFEKSSGTPCEKVLVYRVCEKRLTLGDLILSYRGTDFRFLNFRKLFVGLRGGCRRSSDDTYPNLQRLPETEYRYRTSTCRVMLDNWNSTISYVFLLFHRLRDLSSLRCRILFSRTRLVGLGR